LVTFGSQLRQQFVRAFPAHVDVSVLGWLWSRYGGRWRNLYRDTDAIAGPVLSWDHVAERQGQRPQSRRIDGWDRLYDDVIGEETGRRDCGPDWRPLDPTPSDVAQIRRQPGSEVDEAETASTGLRLRAKHDQ